MSLNVIGLISGGKDSLYSLAHCVRLGHKIVALANLHPIDHVDGEAESRDINSHMYQTVGHSCIASYSDALRVPLYRHAISGTNVQATSSYAPTTQDETEDMYELIKNVLKQHPETTALNAGAILSTYQRTRVESVASRLGLVPLAFLWQYPCLPSPAYRPDSLTGLLDDMAVAGCDAIIIKLASGGLDSEFIGDSITASSTRTRLIRHLAALSTNEAELRAAVLGEGGEYETLALGGPHSLWGNQRLAVEISRKYADDGMWYAGIASAKVVSQEEVGSELGPDIPMPSLYDSRFRKIIEENPTMDDMPEQDVARPTRPTSRFTTTTTVTESTLIISNLHTPSHNTTASQQLESIVSKELPAVLVKTGQTRIQKNLSTKLVHVTMLLRDMADFPAVNKVYSQILWPLNVPIPPARVTVAAPLPPNVQVCLHLTFGLTPSSRKGLHVQSRSYWAPANIGPYSQAVNTPFSAIFESSSAPTELIHLAGQIPLVPHTMAMHNGTFVEQATLGLQHLWRVGQERKVDCWPWAVAYTSKSDVSTELVERIGATLQSWRAAHEIDEKGNKYFAESAITRDESSDEEIDVWHTQHNRSNGAGSKIGQTVGDHLHTLPNTMLFDKPGQPVTWTPPLVLAEVGALPRDASIEWWSTGLADLVDKTNRKAIQIHTVLQNTNSGHISGLIMNEMEIYRLVLFLCVTCKQTASRIKHLSELVAEAMGTTSTTTAQLESISLVSSYSYCDINIVCPSEASNTSIIPCYSVWVAVDDISPAQKVAMATLMQIEVLYKHT